MNAAATSVSAEHLYQKLADELGRAIESGRLRPNERLPSVRYTAKQRKISVSTVVQAYQLLEGRGLVEARPQSGHYVRARPKLELLPPRIARAGSAPVRVSVRDQVERVYRAIRNPKLVPFGAALLSPKLVPIDKIARALSSMARAAGAIALSYEPPPGALVLRQKLARRSINWGSPLAQDEFVITVGAMEAISLSVRAVTRPGDTVVVESPVYYGILQLLETLGLRALEVPAGAEGLELPTLETTLKQHKVSAVLAMTSFGNPHGGYMSDEAKEELVRLLARREIPLIEDDIFGDLQHEGERPRPAKAWDRDGLVLLCSSFSKTLAPGMRVGYVSPGRFQKEIEHLQFSYSVAVPTLPQLVMAELLENGTYEHHLRSLRRHLAAQVVDYQRAIVEHFPRGTRVSSPEGGYLLWVELPAGCDATELASRALTAGISVAEGSLFSARGRFKNFVRLNAGYPLDAGMEQALKTLGALATNLS